jgi:hypothetical protein
MTTAPLALPTTGAISKIASVKEAAQLHRMAKAAAEFYRAQEKRENSQKAKAVYILAARRAGEILLQTPRENGGRPQNGCEQTPVTAYQEELDGAGITRFIARTWQKLAEVDGETVERYLLDAKFSQTEYTMNGLLTYAHGKQTRTYTPEGLIKTIGHFVKLYLEDYPGLVDVLVAEFWKWIRGEWQ